MKIAPSNLVGATIWGRLGDLQILLSRKGREERPCIACDVVCPACGSQSCQCCCSASCEHTGRNLSSDPEGFPVELHIRPLVFTLQSLKVCPPCWSCEGHLNPDGTTLRFPSVWFHSHSVVYPHIIYESLQSKNLRAKLSCPWGVGLKSWGEMTETTFAIQPDLVEGVIPSLLALWADIEVLGEVLESEVYSLAEAFLTEASRASMEEG